MIYFIQSGADGPIKIGTCKDDGIELRLSAIQIGNPHDCRVLAVMDGDADMEFALHGRFSRSRIRGEWFDPSPDLLVFISAHGREFIVEKRPRRPIVDDHEWRLRLAQAVDASGLSCRQVSERAGLSVNYVQQILHSRKSPSVSNFLAIASTLGVRISDLIGETDLRSAE